MTESNNFPIIAYDKSGALVDTSLYAPTSLEDAARIAHEVFRNERGCTVSIRDTRSKPAKEYSVDLNVRPSPL
jgi:hypothetical protein